MAARRRAHCTAWLALLLLALAGPCAAEPGLRIYAMDGRPISFQHGGQADGLVVELAQQVQQRLGSHDAIEVVPWARANTLALKEPNVLLLSIVRTPERERTLHFVGPVFQSHIAAFAVRSRAAALRARDPSLLSLRAGARRGSVFVSMARAAGYHLTDETNASESAARMLMLGRFDLWFEGEEIAGNAVLSAGYQLEQVEVMARLAPRPVYFAFSRGTPLALVQAWAAALAELKRDGSFQRIHRKWLPGYELPSEVLPPVQARRQSP